MSELDSYFDLAESLIETYKPRNDLFAAVDDMFYFRWNFPAGMPDWVMKTISTAPHDAVMTTVRTFATVEPYHKVLPMLPNEANRQRANEIETALRYNMRRAGRRNDAKLEWDVMWSATQYAEVAAQVIYLPYQIKVLKALANDTGSKKMKAKARRAEAAKRFGDFAYIVHNPANVYPEWSEYGPEGVLTIRVRAVDEFRNTWGDLSRNVVTDTDYDEGKISYVTSFDYTNYETRCVWGVLSETPDIAVRGAGVKIMEEDNKLGFIPYGIRRWGNSLSTETNERVMPLLHSIYLSGKWDMLNVFESLDASLAIKRAAQPQYAAELPPGQDIELDNTEPVGTAKLPAGTRGFTPLPSQSVDQRLTVQKAQFTSDIWQGSVAKVLQSLEFPSGTAYSSVNQILSVATGSLSPYKLLGENTLAEIDHQSLCWVKYYGAEYDKSATLYGYYSDKTNAGKSVSLPHDTLNPDDLDIEVTLTADIPVDRLQQINGAVLLKQNFRVPEDELLEDLGLGNPADLAKRRDLEDYKATYIQADLKRIAMQPDLEAAQEQMEMQMGAAQQQNQEAMAQEQAAREQEAMIANAQQNASPGNENLGGMGMNPAMGGTPPVQGNRGQR
jgi:hypothetical protein